MKNPIKGLKFSLLDFQSARAGLGMKLAMAAIAIILAGVGGRQGRRTRRRQTSPNDLAKVVLVRQTGRARPAHRMRALRPTAHRGLHVDPPGLVDRGGHPDDALQPPRYPVGAADVDAARRVLLEGDAAGADSKARRALHHLPHRGGRLHLRPAGPAAEDPDEGGGRRRKDLVVPGRDVHRWTRTPTT